MDEKLDPWLLEVNLSPACSEREGYLTEMVDDMAAGLFNILEQDELKELEIYKEKLEISKKQNDKIEFLKSIEGTKIEDLDDETYKRYKKYMGKVPGATNITGTVKLEASMMLNQSSFLMNKSSMIASKALVLDSRLPVKLMNSFIGFSETIKFDEKNRKYFWRLIHEAK